MKRKFGLSVVVFLTCVTILLGGCNQEGAQVPDGSGEAKEELTVAGREIAYTLNPTKQNTSSFLRRIGAAEALFKAEADGRVVPDLAESGTQVNATTWEIKLRSDVTFWSGKTVDTDAVIASLEHSKEVDASATTYLKDLTFAKVDDRTIAVTTARKNLPVTLNLSYYQTVIHNVDAVYESVETTDLTGMYTITGYVPNQEMILEINENYWGKKPTIKKIINLKVDDDQTRVLMAQNGEADIVLDIPTSSVEQLKASNSLSLTDTPTANVQTIYLNLQQPKLQDEKVRQALSWALNREELVLLGAEGQSSPITTWLGANPFYSAEAKEAVYATTADTEKAAKLLDEAGWISGEDGVRKKGDDPLTIGLMTWGSEKALGEAIQSQWTAVGVNVELKHVDYTLIEEARKAGDWDAFIEAWGTFGEAYSLLNGQFGIDGSANYGGYRDDVINELLANLGAAPDDDARKRSALEINERVATQAPVICMYSRPAIVAVSTSLEGFSEHFRQFEYLVNADLKFIN